MTDVANVAQMVEQPRCNGQVVGSSPTGGLETELIAQLDDVKLERSQQPKYSERWNELGVEMGRITAAIWKLRREKPRQLVTE